MAAKTDSANSIPYRIPIDWEWKLLSEVGKINPRRPKITRDDSDQTSPNTSANQLQKK